MAQEVDPATLALMRQSDSELKGYLQKKGEVGILKSYKQRWFQQNDNKIFYFVNATEKVPQGFIDISNFTLVLNKEPGAPPFSFGIRSPSRLYNLSAENKAEMDYWMNGLQQYKRLKETGSKIISNGKEDEEKKRLSKIQEDETKKIKDSLGNTEEQMKVLQKKVQTMEEESKNKDVEEEKRRKEELGKSAERIKELEKELENTKQKLVESNEVVNRLSMSSRDKESLQERWNQSSEESRTKIEEANQKLAALKKELQLKTEQLQSVAETSQKVSSEFKSQTEQIMEANKQLGIYEGISRSKVLELEKANEQISLVKKELQESKEQVSKSEERERMASEELRRIQEIEKIKEKDQGEKRSAQSEQMKVKE